MHALLPPHLSCCPSLYSPSRPFCSYSQKLTTTTIPCVILPCTLTASPLLLSVFVLALQTFLFLLSETYDYSLCHPFLHSYRLTSLAVRLCTRPPDLFVPTLRNLRLFLVSSFPALLPPYLSCCLSLDSPCRSFRSYSQKLLTFSCVNLKNAAVRSFQYQAPFV